MSPRAEGVFWFCGYRKPAASETQQTEPPGKSGWPLAVTTLSVWEAPLWSDWLSDNDDILSRCWRDALPALSSTIRRRGFRKAWVGTTATSFQGHRTLTILGLEHKLWAAGKRIVGLSSFSSVTQSQYVLMFPNEYAPYDFIIVFKEAFSFIINDVWEIWIIASWFKASSLLNKNTKLSSLSPSLQSAAKWHRSLG